MDVVVVESPAKAKTINKYLGKNYQVLASYGHVRDLPSKDGSVQPDDDFAMDWAVDAKSQKRLNEIASAVKGANRLILATDPDREGEAISWHVLEVLERKKALKDVEVQRVVFNAITKQSVLDAMEHPRALDQELIEAYLARRALDYLVGFTLSPVLWRKLPGARSAGRVQSVALRLVCERELEIEAFVPQEYWSIEADCRAPGDERFLARLATLDGKKVGKFDLPKEDSASAVKARIEAQSFSVASVESKPGKRNPQPPFTTSTLQQEASRKLGFSASRTMQVAQKLYEGVEVDGETTGLITYMRTDGVQIANEAIASARKVIGGEFGERYLPDGPRIYKTKAKNAQEAHEAIRPTDLARLPKQVAGILDNDQRRLYELIWNRTIASQMESAAVERTTIDLASNDKTIGLRATGTVVTFDGFLTLYQEGKDDVGDEESGRLPKLKEGDATPVDTVRADQHFTEPPPRYTEATLVKKLEELGIGRPSTYASILSVLRDRGYVGMDKNRFVPDDKGLLVTAFLANFFERYVEYSFTAELEEKLDKISAGELDWKDVLREFWRDFTANVEETSDLRISQVLDRLNEVLGPHVFPPRDDGTDPRACPKCENGQLSLKVGRFGAFVGCSNYPECRFTRQLTKAQEADAQAAQDTELGKDPVSGESVYLKSGRFGPYVQLGEGEDGEKPKRSSLPKEWPVAELDLDKALALLSLPREVGTHPETGEMITAGIGRYGPFVFHQGSYANLDTVDEVFTVGLNRATAALAEKKSRTRRTSEPLKDLGTHPEDEKPVQVLNGRFGPYVKHGSVNATIPKAKDPQELTLEEALELIEAKRAKAGTKGGAKAKKSTAKSSSTGTKKASTRSSPSKAGASKSAAAKTESKTASKSASKSTTAKTAASKSSASKGAATRSKKSGAKAAEDKAAAGEAAPTADASKVDQTNSYPSD